jgi:DNA-directed RNA polymerase specialized sigma subunit
MSPEDLVIAHADLPAKVAHRFYGAWRGHQDFDDLVSSGRVALAEAARRFLWLGWAPRRDHFGRYAFARILGALRDELRRRDRRGASFVSLEAAFARDCELAWGELLPDPRQVSPDRRMERKERARMVREAVNDLQTPALRDAAQRSLEGKRRSKGEDSLRLLAFDALREHPRIKDLR